MSGPFISSGSLQKFSLWKRMELKRMPFLFELEITARCNLNCRQCYINLPAGDRTAASKELSFDEIRDIVDEAVSLGALWCLVTGGEPLLRDDFLTIYLYLKRKGLMVTVFTNATLVSKEHIDLLKRFPPRDIEVSVYGVSPETYERITRRPGSFAAFQQGLGLLLESGLNVRLKAMIMRSNLHEQHEIAQFCRQNCAISASIPFSTSGMIAIRHETRRSYPKGSRLKRLCFLSIRTWSGSRHSKKNAVKP